MISETTSGICLCFCCLEGSKPTRSRLGFQVQVGHRIWCQTLPLSPPPPRPDLLETPSLLPVPASLLSLALGSFINGQPAVTLTAQQSRCIFLGLRQWDYHWRECTLQHSHDDGWWGSAPDIVLDPKTFLLN